MDSFHGASLDAISIGGEALFRKDVGPLLPGTSHTAPYNPVDCAFGCTDSASRADRVSPCSMRCADYVSYIMDKEGDVGAVIAEPIRWGGHVPPAEYWHRIRKACDEHGALLIFDEIPFGLGRTGNGLFTCQMFGVTPDVLVLGKGLGGGILPFSAVIVREDLNGSVVEKALGHYTHEKNPVLCAAGLATLQYIEDNNLIHHSKVLGEWTLGALREIRERHPSVVGDVRGAGLLLCILISLKERKSPKR